MKMAHSKNVEHTKSWNIKILHFPMTNIERQREREQKKLCALS